MRPSPYQTPNYLSGNLPKPSYHQSHQVDTYHTYEEEDADFDYDEQEMIRNQAFFEYTEGEEKIWQLFKSLDCQECEQMYNNKQRKPQIVCANNHLLCKSCYRTYRLTPVKTRQTSFLCPKCGVRMNTKNTSTHESIQLFLKIYNEIFEKQKCLVEEKRKKTCLDFEVPKIVKTISVLLLLMVMPWIYDALKYVVCLIVDLESKIVGFVVDQVMEVADVVKIIVQDEFYIGLFTNEHGQYVFHGDDLLSRSFNPGETPSNTSFASHAASVLTDKHRAQIEFYFRFLTVAGFAWSKLVRLFKFTYEMVRIVNYILHFIVLVAGVVQFPFAIPFILLRVQKFVPRKYRYKIGMYLDIVEEENADEYLQPEDLQKLSKGELYFFLLVRNFIQWVLQLYNSIEVDMRKRCEELEYKKRMRLMKKNQKEPAAVKPTKRFTF